MHHIKIFSQSNPEGLQSAVNTWFATDKTRNIIDVLSHLTPDPDSPGMRLTIIVHWEPSS